MRAIGLAVVALLATAALESRVTAKQEWRGQRLGAGAITTLRTAAPLISADGVIAPGWYRASIGRPDEQRLSLKLDGAGRWMAVGGDDVLLDGTLSFADPPGKALAIALRPATEQVDPELQALALSIEFGAPRLTVPLTMVGGVAKKVGGATVTWFALPAAMNLLLSDTQARLVPQLELPTADDGFGPLPELSVEQDLIRTVSFAAATGTSDGAADRANGAEPTRHLVVDEVGVTSRKAAPASLRLVLRVGARRAELTVPLEPSQEDGR